MNKNGQRKTKQIRKRKKMVVNEWNIKRYLINWELIRKNRQSIWDQGKIWKQK